MPTLVVGNQSVASRPARPRLGAPKTTLGDGGHDLIPAAPVLLFRLASWVRAAVGRRKNTCLFLLSPVLLVRSTTEDAAKDGGYFSTNGDAFSGASRRI
jgi:hypothetical protein